MEKMKQIVIVIALACYAHAKNVDDPSDTPPAVDRRFFDIGGFLGNLFHGHHHNNFHQPSGGFGGNFNQPQYPVQQNPQQFQNNWQDDRGPQLFPSQEQDSGSNFNQGNLNQGNNFGSGSNQNFNTGTLDDIPPQNGGQMQNSNGNQGFPSQNGGQGIPNQNGGSGFQTPNDWNQGFQNSGFGNPGGFGRQNQNEQGQGNLQGEMYNPVAILGRPVPVKSTPVPDRIVFQDNSDTPAQIQCVQDCETTTEYSPVCGSNNITYFNPGRFVCARNCGINVFLNHPGRCFG